MKKILVVDDDKDILKIFEELATFFGIKIITTTSGYEAIKFINELNNISLVIIDINLPDINGIDIAKQINSKINKLNIIFMTGFLTQDIIKKSKSIGITNFLKKPLQINMLIETIQQYIGTPKANNDNILDNILKQHYNKLQNDYNRYIQITDIMSKSKDIDELAYKFLTYINIYLNLCQSVLLKVDYINNIIIPIKGIGPLTLQEYQKNINNLSQFTLEDILSHYKENIDIAFNNHLKNLKIKLNSNTIFDKIITEKINSPIIVDYKNRYQFQFYFHDTILENFFQTKHYIIIPIIDEQNTIISFIYGNTKFSNQLINLDNFNELHTLIKITQMYIKKSILFEQIKISELKFKSLFENATDIILILNKNLTISHSNKATEKLLKYKEKELIGKHINDFLQTDNKTPVDFSNFLKNNNDEVICFSKTGEKKILEIKINKLQFSNDFYYEIIARDITEKKLLNIKLTKHNFALTNFLQIDSLIKINQPIEKILNIIAHQIEKTKLFKKILVQIFDNNWQPKYIGYAGIKDKDIQDLKKKGFLQKHTRMQLMQEQFKISNSYFIPYESGISKRIKNQIIENKNKQYGTWHPHDILFIPLYSNNKIIGIISLDDPYDYNRPDIETIKILELFADKVSNIISKALMYQKLYKTEQYLSNIIENSADIIIITDINFNIKLFNKSAEQLTGFTKDEILGKKIDILFKSAEELNNYKKMLTNKITKIRNFDTELLTKNKSTLPVQISFSLIKEPINNLLSIEIIAKDMTEHIKYDKIIIKNEKLKTIEKIAISISHEINNPLQIILNNVRNLFEEINEYLTKEPDLKISLKKIRTIWKQVFNIKEITQKLVKLKKLEDIYEIPYTENIKMIDLSSNPEAQFLKDKTILVVDDEQEIRENLKMFLEKNAANVDIAENGVQALEMVKSNNYNCIITDIKMPKMDGYMFYKHLQTLNKNIPVIFLTAFGYDPDHTAIKINSDNIPMPILKPVDPLLLLNKLKHIIKK